MSDMQLLQTGFAKHQSGDLKGAAAIYEDLIRKRSDNYYALHFLGVVRAAEGNFGEAARLMEASLGIQPWNLDFAENYASALMKLERYPDALATCARLLAGNPKNVTALYLSANALAKQGHIQESIERFRQLLRIVPNHFDALNDLAVLFADIERNDEALRCLDQALQLDPGQAAAQLNKANVLAKMQRYDEALGLYHSVVSRKPDPDAYLGIGNALLEQHRFDDAAAAYGKALEIDPGFADAWIGSGNVLAKSGRAQEALDAYDRALALNEKFSGTRRGDSSAYAWIGRGNALAKSGRAREALNAYDRALALNEKFPEAWQGRGHAFRALKQHEDAFAAYDRAFDLKSDLECVAGDRLHAKLQSCNWSDFDKDNASILAGVRDLKPVVTPFILLSLPSSPADQLLCAREYVRRNTPPQPALWRGERYAHDRIRIAYLSADFYDHPAMHVFAGVFEHHDRRRFDPVAISFCPDDGSAIRARVAKCFEHFIDARAMSDAAVAALLREMEIDIAIDITGYAGKARPAVFARRAAPVQVNYVGFPGTLGAPFIDYIIADETVIPPNERVHYAERVAYLPDTYYPADSAQEVSSKVFSRAEAWLPEKGFVFCCFNNTYKLTPSVFDSWMRILRACKGSVLWLIAGAEHNLRAEAEKRGVDPQRLVFAPRMNRAEHLARHRLADLFLDTLPYNAHTTASDALFMGLPVLTRTGSTFAGRAAASLLSAVGMHELIVNSPEEYESHALMIASDPMLHASLKSKLEANRKKHPLFDTARFTRNLEDAYEEMWRRAEAGLPPESFGGSKTPR